MRPTDFIAPALLFAAASTAWPWPSRLRSPVEIAKREIEPLLYPRAPQASKTSFDLSFSGTQGNTATTEQTSAQKTDPPSTGTGSDASNTGSAQSSGQKTDGSSGQSTTGKPTGNTSKGGSTGSGSSGKSTPTSSKTYDPRLPAGGVSMITPNAMTPQYYKVKDWVTFAWNYTSLSATPSAVDILASCSTNAATYTIALNQTIPTGANELQTVLWDTGAYQATATQPLVIGTYTLLIYDAQSSVSATAQAGYLGVYDQFTFGMYIPQAYVPIQDWVCVACSGASGLERQTMGFIAGTVVITVLSFSWFAGIAGIW